MTTKERDLLLMTGDRLPQPHKLFWAYDFLPMKFSSPNSLEFIHAPLHTPEDVRLIIPEALGGSVTAKEVIVAREFLDLRFAIILGVSKSTSYDGLTKEEERKRRQEVKKALSPQLYKYFSLLNIPPSREHGYSGSNIEYFPGITIWNLSDEPEKVRVVGESGPHILTNSGKNNGYRPSIFAELLWKKRGVLLVDKQENGDLYIKEDQYFKA